MNKNMNLELNRREFLKLTSAAGLVGTGLGGMSINAFAADSVNLFTWSAAVDTVKSHANAFEKKFNVGVNYSNSPWAQYRDAGIAKLVGKAPVDVLWVSDAWLPEWVESGWLAPINKYPELMKYNADTADFCVKSMEYKGKQYGLTYYTDYMGFFYDDSKLKKAGITAPPKTWNEVTEQCLKIKAAGICEFPFMLSMAKESWLIEFITAMNYSFGGRFVDDTGKAIMQDPQKGAAQALQWVVDAVQKHKIISPACVEIGELNGLKSFGSGNHAFAMLARYRIRTLNDPKQSAIAGQVKQALMPAGPKGSNATVGWLRFYGLTTQAVADKTREANSIKLIEWFGGKADGKYTFQKNLLNDLGSGFGVNSLFKDPEVIASVNAYTDIKIYESAQKFAKKKDIIAPWFGEWDEANGSLYQSAVLGKSTVENALTKSASVWTDLAKKA